MHGLPHVLAVALIVTQVSGCGLLNLLIGGGPDPLDPDDPFPFPSAEVTFTSGRATIEIDGERVVLDELLEDSGLTEFGYTVTWENEDGWYLQLEGFGEELGFPGGAYLTLHRISDNEHLVILDPSRCVTTTDTVADSGLSGSATCRGLEWTDFFVSYSPTLGGVPKPIEGMEAFNAEITFEAS